MGSKLVQKKQKSFSSDTLKGARPSLRSEEKDFLLPNHKNHARPKLTVLERNSSFLIDTHCHLHDREFFSVEEAETALGRARGRGIEKIICIGTSDADSLAAAEFAREHENVFCTYGIHPENASINDEAFIFRAGSHRSRPSPWGERANPRAAALRNTLRRNINASPVDNSTASPIAIGEVGLDYHYEDYDRTAQIRLFEEMLQLAVEHDLPVSFHVREAFADFFPVVANFPTVRGVVHSFTDNKKVLRRILTETDFYVGMNGLATYSTLPTPPLERILLETDAPFLAPVPHRGEANEPAFIADIAQWLAQKLEISEAEVARATTKNAVKLFGEKLSA